ncbi:MAG TPA: MFS transporter [Clostridiales bacterium]|nr:MAG: Glucuronide carrier protein [Firmicutes bacterium ADurb.Bin262]HOU10712.1 MFS transporter [Clostridiales bacterium]HQK74261.1 MFS transporter [Clostridiales bacterium]
MADKKQASAVDKKEDKALEYVHTYRRYIGTKETFAYILNDFSNSFNIGKYQNRFIWDVVLIDFKITAFVNIFTGIWDTVNDIFIGTIVDKTRTRWGKFKPYVLFLKIPLTVVGSLYWFLPFIFPNTPADYMPKLIFYFAFGVVMETAGTFSGIAQGGLMSTITPHPIDRVRLITQANFWSGFIGEKLPELLMGVFIDLINNKIVRWKLRDLFVGMGLLTSIIATAASFFFIFVTRERVQQTIEKPSIMQGLKAIVNNIPILMITLSGFLSGFGVSIGRQNYFIDVLGAATLQTIVGIPASPVSSASYALIGPMRKRFSTKAIWIAEDLYTDMCWLSVFAIGSINNNFTKRKVMIPTFMVEEFIEMWTYGLRHVIGQELYNEAMDYCEWKNGYRMEAMTSVARGLVSKLQGIVMSSVTNLIMAKIGYIQGKTIGTQALRTKWWIFAMGTGVPVITSSLGVLPKFLYPLTGPRRDKMYADLLERRKQMAARVSNADPEELARIAKAEIRGEFVHNRDLDS